MKICEVLEKELVICSICHKMQLLPKKKRTEYICDECLENRKKA